MALRQLSSMPRGVVPGQVIKALEQYQFLISQNNLFMAGELIRLLEMLSSNNIPAVTFKGPALAEKIYGDLSLREFSDLDIVVPRASVVDAVRLLQKNGYWIVNGLSLQQIGPLLSVEHHLLLQHRDHRIPVELHWVLFNKNFSLNYPLEHWWANVPARPSGLGWPAIPDEEMLFLLCAHGTKHRWEKLKWLVDIAELIKRSDGIDWARLDRMVKNHHCSKIVGIGLLLAHDWLHAPVPSTVVRKIKTETEVQRLTKDIVSDWDDDYVWPQSKLQWLKFQLAIRDRTVDKFKFALAPLRGSKPADWRIVSLPKGLFPLYYFIRLAGLGWRWLVKPLWRFFAGGKGVRNQDHDG